jgi:hypothetical protein
MKLLARAPRKTSLCTICGNRKQDTETWFVVSQNELEDRLKVWKWDPGLLVTSNTQSLCSPRHVRELVVHWMLTGCLHYPFAASPNAVQDVRVNFPARADRRHAGALDRLYLGEIAVDREGILRALRENPLSLNTILDELNLLLEKELVENAETEPEDESSFALPSM